MWLKNWIWGLIVSQMYDNLHYSWHKKGLNMENLLEKMITFNPSHTLSVNVFFHHINRKCIHPYEFPELTISSGDEQNQQLFRWNSLKSRLCTTQQMLFWQQLIFWFQLVQDSLKKTVKMKRFYVVSSLFLALRSILVKK